MTYLRLCHLGSPSKFDLRAFVNSGTLSLLKIYVKRRCFRYSAVTNLIFSVPSGVRYPSSESRARGSHPLLYKVGLQEDISQRKG